ncbi:hypothetical protein ACWFPY_25295 [Nocardia fluminea]
MLAAEDARERGVEQLDQLVDEAAAITREIGTTRAEVDRLEGLPVTSMSGDVITAGDAGTRMAMIGTTVTEEHDMGIVNHRRVPLPSLLNTSGFRAAGITSTGSVRVTDRRSTRRRHTA